MVNHAEDDRQLCEQLKKVLKLTKGWEEARDHARKAVPVDNNVRLWWINPEKTKALLFNCHEGTVKLDAALGEGLPLANLVLVLGRACLMAFLGL
jgi:hypothetical protein